MRVGHLRLHTRRDEAHSARLRIERALASAEPATRRLVLVRRMDLGHLPAGSLERGMQERVSRSLEAICASARHGGLPGAREANAVWFRSRGEAVALFWDRVLSGSRPDAWFWRMVMPSYRPMSVRGIVAAGLAQARHEPKTRLTIGRAVLRAASRGQGARVVDLLAPSLSANEPTLAKVVAPSLRPASASARARNPRKIAAKPLQPAPPVEPRDSAYLSLSAPALSIVRMAVQRLAPAQARALAEIVIAAERPDWIDTPTRLAAKAAAAVEVVRAEIAKADSSTWQLPTRMSERRPEPVRSHDKVEVEDNRASDDVRPTNEQPTAPDGSPRPEVPDTTGQTLLSAEAVFAKAGLFLVLPLLNRLGLHEAIECDNLSQRHNFAAELLVQMALSFGRDDGEAMIGWLGLDAEASRHAREELAAPLRFWMRAADKALRHLARRRLHDLAIQSGWMLRDDEVLDIRFPLESADIALRRRALDVDPGWVPWLGRVVHFHFSDSPLDAAA